MEPNGHGQLTKMCGEYFVGDFKEGKFHGNGTKFHKNGKIQERGEFRNNRLYNGMKYEGSNYIKISKRELNWIFICSFKVKIYFNEWGSRKQVSFLSFLLVFLELNSTTLKLLSKKGQITTNSLTIKKIINNYLPKK